MKNNLNSEQVALVTGASSGMGKVTALRLLKDGFKVIAAARRIEQMSDLKKQGAEVVNWDTESGFSISSSGFCQPGQAVGVAPAQTALSFVGRL